MFEQEQFFINTISYHFNLRNPKGDKPTPIYMVIRLKGKQYKFPIGCKVIPLQWDKRKERPFISPYLNQLDNHNNQIAFNKILEYISMIRNFLTYIFNNPISEDDFLKLLNEKFNKKNMTKRDKRNALIDMGNLIDTQRMSNDSKYCYQSELKSFTTFIRESKNKVILSWSEITLSLLADYESWLNNQQVKHKITQESVFLEDNTIIGKMQKMYTILTYAEQKELIDLKDTKLYKLKDKKKKKDKVEENQIYLTEKELCSIEKLILKDEMEKVRDLFIFQNEVGQRYEDINGCNPVVKGNKMKIYQKKTKKFIYAPISKLAQTILEKYNNKLPQISIQKANKLIKEIAKQAGIKYRVEVCENRGGNPYRYEVEAWQLVGTHTARRSFISNGLKSTDSNVLRKITGHSTDNAFNRYNRLSSEDAANIIINNQPHITNAEENKIEELFRCMKQEMRESIKLEEENKEKIKEVEYLKTQLKNINDYEDVFSIDDYIDKISEKAMWEDQEIMKYERP